MDSSKLILGPLHAEVKLVRSKKVYNAKESADEKDDESDASVGGTVVIRNVGSRGGSRIQRTKSSNSAEDEDDDEGTGTMVIRDEETLERLQSGEQETVDEASSVIVNSSKSETQLNSPRPWLNKYRTPETWVPFLYARWHNRHLLFSIMISPCLSRSETSSRWRKGSSPRR